MPETVESPRSSLLQRKQSIGEKFATIVVKRVARSIDLHNRDITCQPVQNLTEMKEAYHLVYSQYIKKTYCQPNASNLHYTYFCFLPDTRTFIMKKDNVLLGTVTLIPDSDCGLPMGSLFDDELERFRTPNSRLAEVSLLVLNQDLLRLDSSPLCQFKRTCYLFLLFKTLFDYARICSKVTDLVMCVHPKHESFYRFLFFQSIGPVRSYAGACHKPAVPMRLGIVEKMGGSPQDIVDQFFFKEPYSKKGWEKYVRLNSEEQKQMFFEFLPLWEKMPQFVRSHFRNIP